MQLRTHPDNPFPVYIPSHNSSDSRHFDRPVGRRHFEGVADVAGNRCIKRGRNSIRLHGKQRVGAFFSRPGYTQKYHTFFDVVRNKGHALRVPSDVKNKQFKFGGDLISRYRYIRARAVQQQESPEYDDRLLV